MPAVATVASKSLPRKKLIMIGLAVAIPLLIAIAVGLYFLMQGTSARASEEAPQNVSVNSSDPENIKITWATGVDTTAVVEYGTEPDSSSFSEFAFSELESTDHLVQIPGLQPETTYYFRIQSGENYYDNNGELWTFTTPPAGTGSLTPTGESGNIPLVSEIPLASAAASIQPTPSQTPIVFPTASASATIVPSPTSIFYYTPTPTATITATLTPTVTTASSVCKSYNCTSILQALGTTCSSADYVRCLLYANITITQGPTNTPTPTPISAALRAQCKQSYIQSNSCTSFIWDSMTAKEEECEDTFTRYFVQCKSNSFSSTDANMTWFCNKTVTSNQLTLPCDTAPTPAPGQAIFCRVRAENARGGAANATDWIYGNTTCGTYSTVADVTTCQIGYLQANTCRSWIWGLENGKDPQCAAAFNHYYLQCTNDGDFDSASSWYCNKTSTTHYLDFPCYNAITPADGQAITCRVRAEDAYSTAGHAGSWVSTAFTCPTSTPTPTP